METVSRSLRGAMLAEKLRNCLGADGRPLEQLSMHTLVGECGKTDQWRLREEDCSSSSEGSSHIARLARHGAKD